MCAGHWSCRISDIVSAGWGHDPAAANLEDDVSWDVDCRYGQPHNDNLWLPDAITTCRDAALNTSVNPEGVAPGP